MKPIDFDYARAASIDAVCRLLNEAGGDAKIIAGGQTLVPLLAMRLARPALVVDINGIAALQGIYEAGSSVAVRACTRQASALAHAVVRRDAPLLRKALSFVGHVQTRNRGTVGGSLANADPAAEIGLAALALDAELRARSIAGERTIAVRGFFLGPMETALLPEECLTEIRFPIWSGGAVGTGFQEVSIRHSDFALASAAAQILLDRHGACRRAAVCVGGAGAAPIRLGEAERRLLGTRLEDSDIEAAAAIAREAIEPPSDPHASPLYRRRLAGALVARALAEARDEAKAGA